MGYDIRCVKDMRGLIQYFSEVLDWHIDLDDFIDIEDITYDFDAGDIGLKEEAFVKISSLRQLQPLVDQQKWGIFCVEFDSQRFEVSALRKILSGLVPKRRNATDHAVWSQRDLLFICLWGTDNSTTIGLAHFEDKESGLPQIKMISCAQAVEDFTQIRVFESRLAKLAWPKDVTNHEAWRALWSDAFITGYRQTIHDSATLTVQLAAEAQNIRNRILDILEVESVNGYVHLLYEKFKNTLIHDMTEQQFADMYAQTVVYGLFSARCMDDSQEDFSAAEAIDCIPSTNPFLKSLMRECLGSQNNSKLSFDELEIGNVVDLLVHTRTDAIIQDFNRQTGGGKEDPVIHFYEEFLTAYDKAQKVQRGVFYTPQPVVNFIVRAVDSILKTEFGLEEGLASTGTKKIKQKRQSLRKIEGLIREIDEIVEVPAIQVLDPATGTGTFLRQTILQIYANFRESHKGEKPEQIAQAWNEYVPTHLLSRLNGFELMMAPYAVAHMKLAMVLKDTGYDFAEDVRLNVYLTNALEEPGSSEKQLTFWDDPLAAESVEANGAKKNRGINIVMGNPPYNVSSNNRSEWIINLLSDYKSGLTERKLNLDDDYIKFLKLAQTYLKMAGSGIVAFITNNSYIDGVSHRRIRESLLETFEQVYIIDLHGNVMKQERAKDGGKDENVFDITQGVAICFLVKKPGARRCVRHIDLMGLREKKYEFLNRTSLDEIVWSELEPKAPEFLFIPYSYDLKAEYEKGFKVSDLFSVFNSGIQTKCDEISVCFSSMEAQKVINLFETHSVDDIKSRYPSKNDGRDWTFALAKKDIMTADGDIVPYYYRPFDVRFIRYSGVTKGLIAYPRRETMTHVVGHKNLSLCMMKQFFQDVVYNHIFVTNLAIDERFLYSNRGGTYIFPLYQYFGEGELLEKEYNFNDETVKKIEESIGLKLSKEKAEGCFTGEELLQYIYAILYNRAYRNKYNDQLKYDFPSIPYPQDPSMFFALCAYGSELISLHLPDEYYPVNESTKLLPELISYKFLGSKVVLNEQLSIEAFEGAKDFQLGGYKPADKWLKDRKGKPFTEKDRENYIKLIKALQKTDAIMEKIELLQSF